MVGEINQMRQLKVKWSVGAAMDLYYYGGHTILDDDLVVKLKDTNCKILHPDNWDYFDWVDYTEHGILKLKL